jgi:C1A family cysteine protease
MRKDDRMSGIAAKWAMRLISVVFLFVLSVSFASQSFAFDETLSSIQQAIESKGADWVAGETSVSKMEPEERRKLLGLIKPDPMDAEAMAAVDESLTSLETALPSKLDWRSYNGKKYVTPVRNQSSCGSCWAFAATGAAESKFLMELNSPNTNRDLAEQILVSCSGAGGCGGGYHSYASDYLQDVGLPVESCFPYSATDEDCGGACANWKSYTYNIKGWLWATYTSPTVNALKSALNTYGPLVTTMDVYADFYSYTSGIYSYVSGAYQGGHAILLVGYNDETQCFIAKNSWGTGWGENGYFRVAYSQLSNAVEFGYYTIAYKGAMPAGDSSCGYVLSSSAANVAYSGGSKSLKVWARGTCAWTAVSNASWITITAGNTGPGNKTVQYKVAANGTTQSRTGTLTIAGKTYMVKQAARP